MQIEKTFAYGDRMVRMIEIDGARWWAANDVCRCLDIRNNRDALERMPGKEKRVVDRTILPPPLSVKPTGGKEQWEQSPGEILMVNDQGLYRLIFRSEKPAARKFQDWVFYEVLPALEKSGVFQIGGMDIGETYRLARTGAAQVEVLRIWRELAGLAGGRAASKPEVLPDARPVVEVERFWDAVLQALKASALARDNFKMIGRYLYFKPGPVIAAVQVHFGDAEQRDFRRALLADARWSQSSSESNHRQRFGPGRAPEPCWCVKINAEESGSLLDIAALLAPSATP